MARKQTTTKKNYGTRLMKLREGMGFTQRQMAEEFRVTHGAIGLWERNERPVTGPVTKLIEIYEERVVRRPDQNPSHA